MDMEVRSASMSVSSTIESQRVVTPPSSETSMEATLVLKGRTEEADKVPIEKAKMPVPAHLDVNIVSPTPPKMTRLPSLKQLSDKFQPSPLSDTHTPIEETPEGRTPGTTLPLASTQPHAPLATPPKLKVAINPQATTSVQSSGSPFTASPSGRLRLPMSAMTRSHSSGSTSSHGGPLPPIPPFRRGSEEDKTLTTIEKNTDPFGPIPSSAGPSSGTMSRGSSTDGYIKGYKDVPSLAAIRERVSYSKSSGKQVAEMLKEAGKGEDKENVKPSASQVSISVTSMTPPVKAQGPEHSLQHSWTLYFDAKSLKPDLSITAAASGRPILGDYEKSLVTVGEFTTVEGFARHVNNIKLPSSLSKNSNYHLFKNGIRPMWEDPANANGGKWVVLFKNAPALLDHSWANLTMALVGEMLDPDDEVCGVVASTKSKVDRVQVWTRGRSDVERINELGKRIVEVLGLEGRELECMSMEFQYNISNPNPPPNLFMSIPYGAPRSSSISAQHPHAPPTPSKLGFSSSPNPNVSPSPRLTHPSLPAIPKSPTPQGLGGFANLPKPPRSASPLPVPRSPTNPSDRLGAPGREVRRLSAGSAFAGPMGGAAKSGMMKREMSAGAGPVAAGIR